MASVEPTEIYGSVNILTGLDPAIYGDGSLYVASGFRDDGVQTSLNTTDTIIKDGIVAVNTDVDLNCAIGSDGGLWINRNVYDVISDVPEAFGVAQSGTLTSVTLDPGSSAINNEYVGWTIYIYGGTGVGQVNVITAYDGTTKIATVNSDWSILPDITSQYYLYNTSTAAMFYDTSNKEFALAYTVDPHTANPLDITKYANLHVNDITISGDIIGFYEIVTLIENSSTPADIQNSAFRGSFVIVVESVLSDGACATFTASNRSATSVGNTNRTSSSPGITGVELQIQWPAGNKIQLYHSVTGPDPTPLQYRVLTKNAAFIGGEANTASNIGLAGVGLFNSKVGVDLQFKNIAPGSSKISVVNDAPNFDVNIDVVEANLNINNLGGGPLTVPKGGTGAITFNAGELIQGNGAGALTSTGILAANVVTLNGVQTLTNKTLTSITNNITAKSLFANSSAVTVNVNGPTVPTAGYVLTMTGATQADWLPASGESNTASNVGLAGVGLFKAKVGVDLQFKNIAPGSSKISVTNDVPNSDVNIDVVEANLNINNLGGGPLTVPKGGTGATTFNTGELIQGNGAGALTSTGILTTNVVTLNGIQTLTNKTLTSPTNTITANALFANSSAVTVNVNGPTVPVVGYVLKMISLTQADWQPDTGEANTASNVGLAGVGLFKAKVGVDLQFKNIAPASSKISVVNDIPNSDVNIDVVEANLNINNLGGGPLTVPKGGTGAITFNTGELIQGNGAGALSSTGILTTNVVTLNGIQTLTNKTLTSTTNTITANALFANSSAVTVNVNGPTVPVVGYVLKMISLTQADWQPDSGEANTASNVGLAGVGLFKAKVGVDLQFKNIAPGSSKISVVNDVPNSDVNIDVVEANLNINNLGGGPLTVPKGGTGATTFNTGELIQGNGAGALTSTGILASNVVTLNGIQTLTNKTLTSPTNTITANALFANSSAVTVNVNGPTVPVAGYILTMTSGTQADWQPVPAVSTKKIAFNLTDGTWSISSAAYIELGDFSWKNSLFSGYTGGTVVYYAEITGASLDIRLYNVTAGTVLGSDLGVAVTGVRTFSVVNPPADAELEIQAQKSGGGANPRVSGVNVLYVQ